MQESIRNEKPQDLAQTKSQGVCQMKSNSKSTAELSESKARYDKGFELYKSNRASIGPNGLFKVCGFEVDTEKTECECPNYQKRHEPCKHYFAACFFLKNHRKGTIEHLEGKVPHAEQSGNGAKSEPEAKQASEKPTEAPIKPFDRQATITRLAVLNTATEILKTLRYPVEVSIVISLASQLEKWALGN